jgi:hypothetical protein
LYLFPTLEMAVQSGSTRFHELFESALRAYEKKAGVTLAEHPLAVQLQSCKSVDSITTVLQGQAQLFGDFRGRDRVMRSLKSTVSTLIRLSTTTCLAVDIGLVRHQALMACSTPLTCFTAITSCESNTRWSRYPTCRM